MSTLNLEGTFVEFLFERLLFEHILTQNSQTGCCIDPELMAVKFDYLYEYYDNLGMKWLTISGRPLSIGSDWTLYRALASSLTGKFDLGPENEDSLNHVYCPCMSNKQIKDFKRDFAARIPQDYQEEISLMLNILKANGLMGSASCGHYSGDDDGSNEGEDSDYC